MTLRYNYENSPDTTKNSNKITYIVADLSS